MSPVIVYVLPVPVWPYAKIVQLKPPKTCWAVSSGLVHGGTCTCLVQDGCDDFVKDHALVGSG